MCIVLRWTKNGLVYYFLVICIYNSHTKHILRARLHSYVKTLIFPPLAVYFTSLTALDREQLFYFFVTRPNTLLIAVRRGYAPSPQTLRKSSDSRDHAITPAKPLSFTY